MTTRTRGLKRLVMPSHAEFIDQIVQLAHLLGWSVALFRKARTKHGWVTPVGADGVGWLDLVLERERLIFAEVKVPPDKATPEQLEWCERHVAAGQEWYIWTWSERWLDQITEILRRREPDRPAEALRDAQAGRRGGEEIE